MAPKISVIVPVYNVEKYLERCVDSILSQTFQDLEIILVDDGSPDACPEMCEDYAKRDGRIKVVHKENAGLGMARNTGLDAAGGEFVIFLDSDDWMDPCQCECLFNDISRTDCDFALCGYKDVSDEEILRVHQICKKRVAVESGELLRLYLTDKVNMSVWHGIYRRSFIEENNFRFLSEREIVSEDVTFSIRMAKASSKVLLLPYAPQNYYKNSCSITSARVSQRYEKMLRMFDEVKSYFDKEKQVEFKTHFDAFFLLRAFDVLALDFKQNPDDVGIFQCVSKDAEFRSKVSLRSLRLCPFKKGVSVFILNLHMPNVVVRLFRLKNKIRL